MDRKQTLLVGLLLASVAALITWRATSPKVQREPVREAMRYVLVTTRSFGKWAPLDPGGVEVKPLPPEKVPPDAVTWGDAVRGRYAARPLEVGTILQRSDLWEGKVLDLTQNLPGGRRALNIKVAKEVNFGQGLQPGQWVDVMGTFPQERKVIQGAQVLGVYRPSGQAPGETDQMVVTLSVTPADADRLLQAEEAGRLRLVLRPAPGREKIEPSRPPATVSQPAPKVPAPPKVAPSKTAPSGKAKAPTAAPKPSRPVQKIAPRAKAKPKPSYRRPSARRKAKSSYRRRSSSQSHKVASRPPHKWEVKVIRGTDLQKVTVGR